MRGQGWRGRSAAARTPVTGFPTCEFPDAYVDPYPEAWGGLVRMAELGQQLAMSVPATTANGSLGTMLAAYFQEVATDAALLQAMAQQELAGQPLTTAQLAFINEAVDEQTVNQGCVQVQVPTGGTRASSSIPPTSPRWIPRSPTCTRTRPTVSCFTWRRVFRA